MKEEEQEVNAAAVSEQVDNPPQEENQHEDQLQEEQQEEQKNVPLAALQAERRKRQEYEHRLKVYEDLLSQQRQQPQEAAEEEDPDALLTRSAYTQEKKIAQREIYEQVYQDMNPGVVQKLNTYLKPILDKKPWLASTIENSHNRLARANEIVDDYKHILEEKPKVTTKPDAKRIVENSKKPRSPAEVGKSAQPKGTEFLKSIQGKKEFREYRQKVLRGEA